MKLLKRVFLFFVNRLSNVDPWLALVVGVITFIGFLALLSASYSFPYRITDQARNIFLAMIVMIVVANIRPRILMQLAPVLYIAGVVLLAATLAGGTTIKGATRWLSLGIAQIQPSELMKIALPLMLAKFFSTRQKEISGRDFLTAAALIAVPVLLILKQPDLGTAILVGSAGAVVVFFAGIPWRWLAGITAGACAAAPFAWFFLLHDYQRERVLTLIDPTTDPLGKGFHTLQAMIAIGSGGLLGKGWMEGTQANLGFIPERTSDFLFAVYSEEFGLMGNLAILLLYFILICLAMFIALKARNSFSKLLAAALGTIFFAYTFVNMGMVSGILPVVGVPLPFMSYGGTALITLGTCTGMLMAISAEGKQYAKETL